MEYSIIHSDLNDDEIKPQPLIKKYIELLGGDIREIFDRKTFVAAGCPTDGSTKPKGRFKKLGMEYCVSSTFANVYVSPRPAQKELLEFYQKSRAREFWLKEIWPQTKAARQRKIITPLMDWVKTFVQQYLKADSIKIAEYYPNQWGFFEGVGNSQPKWDYSLIQPMFALSLADQPYLQEHVINDDHDERQFDCVFLFEALDRSEDPAATLQWVNRHLKPNGLCFVTALLSSGFEMQILGQESSAFVPPERMNLFSYEGLITLIGKFRDLQILEFSTPGVLDIPNIIYAMEQRESNIPSFMQYIIGTRKDPSLFQAFQDFLQMNKLSTFGRLVLRKGK